MKRFFALVLSAALAAGLVLPVHGAGEVTGYALYTDIVAQIDGRPIPSYNVGGRTAVMVADLAWYGFYVYWNEEARAAYVWPESLLPDGDWEREAPDYTPQAPEGRVGDPAYPIYASDVKVFVAGEEKVSFNIDGRTLVYLSDLTAYGDLAWNEEVRLAELTLAEDPVELALGRMEAVLDGSDGSPYYSGLDYYFDRYPGPHGTLAVCGQYGTTHGTSCLMLYVDRSGQQTRVDTLLPAYGFGPQYYLEPSAIQFDASGDNLTFVTPVKEVVNWATGESKEWGDTLCTFNTLTGQMVSMLPKGQPLEQWSVSCSSYEEERVALGMPLEVTVTHGAWEYEVRPVTQQLPDTGMTVSVSSSGVFISHDMAFPSEGQEDSPYSQALRALTDLALPRITQEDFVQENTPEQREQVAQWFRVTKNGAPVTGVLWISQGNGHWDWNFTFDQSVSMAEGDVLTLEVGPLAQSVSVPDV